MNVTREVVTDLLPLYLSGEASADTRGLVEAFLRSDPEFARIVRDDRIPAMLRGLDAMPSPDVEKRTLDRHQRATVVRRWALPFALFFSLLPLSSHGSSKGVEWIMIRDSPAVALASIAIAALCWVVYFVARMPGRHTPASGGRAATC